VVEGARLESVFRGNSNVGSNPTLSAMKSFQLLRPFAVLISSLYMATLGRQRYGPGLLSRV
jgi:hypothetical protein